MGCMSLDATTLEVKARTSKTSLERRQARTLLGFVKRKHLVLVSVIIVNMAVNEALPVFLDRLVPTFASIIISTTLVVLVGEVLPSAIFTGKDQIRLVYKLLPILRATIMLTLCISYPLSKFLDDHLHPDDDDEEEGERFNREEISAYVRIKYEQNREQQPRTSATDIPSTPPEEQEDTLPGLLMPEGGLDELCCGGATRQSNNVCGSMSNAASLQGLRAVDLDDVTNVERILSFREKLVEESFTPLDQVYATVSSTVIDEDFVLEAYRRGFSRILVYTENGGISNICGVLITSHLLLVDKMAQRPVGTMPLYRPICCSPHTSVAELMERFRGGSTSTMYAQLAIVCEHPRVANEALTRGDGIPPGAGVKGIITFDDILRSVFGYIPDEKSRRSNRSIERAKWAVGKWKCFVLNRQAQREQEALVVEAGGSKRSRTVPHHDGKISFQYRALMDHNDSSSGKGLPEIV
jgi:metal transporter CNNM